MCFTISLVSVSPFKYTIHVMSDFSNDQCGSLFHLLSTHPTNLPLEKKQPFLRSLSSNMGFCLLAIQKADSLVIYNPYLLLQIPLETYSEYRYQQPPLSDLNFRETYWPIDPPYAAQCQVHVKISLYIPLYSDVSSELWQ